MKEEDNNNCPEWESGGRKIAPGLYVVDDCLQVDVPELCNHFGVENTIENREWMMRLASEAAAETFNIKEVYEDRAEICPICKGVGRVYGFQCSRCGGKGHAHLRTRVVR